MLAAGPDRGWGLRCQRAIPEGEFVVEVVGQCLRDADYAALEDNSYAVGFPDNVIAAKKRMRDRLMYIDPKRYGSLMRFVNDSQEAPNLSLVYWPPFDEANGESPPSCAEII